MTPATKMTVRINQAVTNIAPDVCVGVISPVRRGKTKGKLFIQIRVKE